MNISCFAHVLRCAYETDFWKLSETPTMMICLTGELIALCYLTQAMIARVPNYLGSR